MQDFRNLEIYKRSIQFCTDIYKFTAILPDDEKYGLVSQIRRAACSIALNISEGAGAGSNKEFAQFISYSYRSVNEVMTCLEIIENLKLNHEKNIDHLKKESCELSRMIYSFFKKISGK